MKTRLARQTDVLRVRKLAANATSVLEPSLLDDTRSVVSSLFMPGSEKVWIADKDSEPVGLAQARPRRVVLGWELLRLQVRRDQAEVAVATELVQEVLQHLQERGIPRLFARTAENSKALETLMRCGFTSLMSESIFVRHPGPVRAPEETPSGLRYRMAQDAWPLRQLESSQTPQLISQLEGLTSSNWSMPNHQVFRKDEQTDLIIERDSEIVGWAGWAFVGPGHGLREHARLALLVDADQLDAATALIDYALYAITTKRPAAQVIVRLRDYQAPLQTALSQRGFTEEAREILLIKHGRLQTIPKSPRKLFEQLAPAQRTALSIESA